MVFSLVNFISFQFSFFKFFFTTTGDKYQFEVLSSLVMFMR
jgi:hypothetical protein